MCGADAGAEEPYAQSKWLVKGSGTLATVDERKETSLRACIAHMLHIDVSEVPKKREANMGQWLALRNLGLVPVASPETFEWPGRFLGLRSDSSTWAVFFGVPPGIIYDPSAEPVEGRGLLGDRYERQAGTFSNPKGGGYDLTLVEAEALEELFAKGVELSPIDARRNIVVRGIALHELIGRRFRVGEVECYGQRRCEPCSHLERLTQPGVLRGLVHRGGLRADVLSGGRIRTGDSVAALT